MKRLPTIAKNVFEYMISPIFVECDHTMEGFDKTINTSLSTITKLSFHRCITCGKEESCTPRSTGKGGYVCAICGKKC